MMTICLLCFRIPKEYYILLLQQRLRGRSLRVEGATTKRVRPSMLREEITLGASRDTGPRRVVDEPVGTCVLFHKGSL